MMNRHPKHEENREKFNGSRSNSMKKKKKNMRRMGGQGLSLEAFANAKSNSSYFNPALIKKQKEFYKNSKYVNKYKKSLKQQQGNPPLAIRRFEEEIETEYGKKEGGTEYVSKKENGTECGIEMENGTGDDSRKENGTGDDSRKENETGGGSKMSRNDKKKNKYGARSIFKVYEMKHEDEEKARMEREAIIQAKKEEREKAETRRKSAREKMLKKTRKGQPVMKYRIQHLLETIQGFSKQT